MGLIRFVSYSKRPLNNLELLLTIRVSYFLFFTYLKSSRITITWTENLPHINKFFSSSFSFASPAIRIPKLVYVWQQLDSKVYVWFPELHSIELACEFLPLISNCSTKWTDFRLRTSLIWKNEKNCHVRRRVLQKSSPKNFLKIDREIPVRRSLSNNVKSFLGVRLATLLKKDPLTGVWDQAVCGYTIK